MLHFLVSPWGSTLACCKLGGDLVSSPTPGVELHWNNPKAQKGRVNLEILKVGSLFSTRERSVAGWFLLWGFGVRCFCFPFFYMQWVDILDFMVQDCLTSPERHGWVEDITSFLKTRGWLDTTTEASTVPTWHKHFNPNSFPKMAISISECLVTKSLVLLHPFPLHPKLPYKTGPPNYYNWIYP